MRKVKTYLEMAAMGSFTVVCLAFAYKTLTDVGPGLLEPALPPGLVLADPGSTFADLDGFSPASAQQSLLIALSSQCRFCQESVDFYQRLSSEVEAHTQLVAVFSEPTESAVSFVEKAGMRANILGGVDLHDLGIAGTPTLVLIDSEGVVTATWRGLLSPEQEEEVMARLRS